MTLLDNVLSPGGISVVFQPIFEWTSEGWSVHALEGLVRGPTGTTLERADVLFEYVRRKHAEAVVDRRCISSVLAAARDLPGSPRIAINAHAASISGDRTFLRFFELALALIGMPPERVVVEVVERSPAWNHKRLPAVLGELRQLGTCIALDDVGIGESNMQMMLECRPDYFKVDKYLVTGSKVDSYRRSLLRSVIDLADGLGARAIAEGIEDLDDLATVRAEGFALIQGYFLAEPMTPSALRESPFLRRAAVSPLESLLERQAAS